MTKDKVSLNLSLKGSYKDTKKAQDFINSIDDLEVKHITGGKVRPLKGTLRKISTQPRSVYKAPKGFHFLITTDMAQVVDLTMNLLCGLVAILQLLEYLRKQGKKFDIQLKTKVGTITLSKDEPWTLSEVKRVLKLDYKSNRRTRRKKNTPLRGRSLTPPF